MCRAAYEPLGAACFKSIAPIALGTSALVAGFFALWWRT
jgi:hypothetical protein